MTTTMTMPTLVSGTYASEAVELPETVPVSARADQPDDQVDDDIRHAHNCAGRLVAHTLHFAPVLDGAWCDAIGGELRWLVASIAPAHDVEILNQIITACATALPTIDALNLEPLFSTLALQRSAATTVAVEALASERYSSLRSRVLAAGEHAPVDADDSVTDWVHDTLALAWERLAREIERLETAGERPPEGAHDAARRARLAAEVAATALGDPARRLASALRGVQRLLGAQRGAASTVEWVRREAVNHGPLTNFAAGMASGLMRNSFNTSRSELPAAWSKACRRKDRLWS